MMWEPWIERAFDYNELKVSLRKRRFENLPANGMPELVRQQEKIVHERKPKENVRTTRTKAKKEYAST